MCSYKVDIEGHWAPAVGLLFQLNFSISAISEVTLIQQIGCSSCLRVRGLIVIDYG